MQVVVTHSTRYLFSVLPWRDSKRTSKCPREISLRREVQCERDLRKWSVLRQQHFCLSQTLRADVLIWRLSGRDLERARKVEAAQVRRRSHAADVECLSK